MRQTKKLVWLLALSAMLGCAGSKDRKGFGAWMNKNRTMLSAEAKDCSGNTYTCTYVPRAWTACESGVPVEEIHEEQVVMQIQLTGQSNDVNTFNERLIQYADLAMKNDLTLQYGHEKRMCGVVQVESNFTATGRYRFILFFGGVWDKEISDPPKVIYKGTAFGCKQPVEMTFDALDLSDIPRLDCKN